MATRPDLTSQFPALIDAINARVAAGDGFGEGNQALDLLQRELNLAGFDLNVESALEDTSYITPLFEAQRRHTPTAATAEEIATVATLAAAVAVDASIATETAAVVALELDGALPRQLQSPLPLPQEHEHEHEHVQTRARTASLENGSYQDTADEHLAKRRRLEAEDRMKDAPEVTRHGQVFAQQLPLSLINHDELANRARCGSPSDVLHDDARIYTTDVNPCNFFLMHENDDIFACEQVGVRVALKPTHIAASRTQRFRDMFKLEGLVWISLEESPLHDLLNYKMAYITDGADPNLHHEKRICFFPPGVNGDPPAYSVEAVGHPDFQVTTYHGSKKPPQSMAEYFNPWEPEREQESDIDDSSSIDSSLNGSPRDYADDDGDEDDDDDDDDVDNEESSDELTSDDTTTPPQGSAASGVGVGVAGAASYAAAAAAASASNSSRAREARPLMSHSNASSTNVSSHRRQIPAPVLRDDIPQPYARFTLTMDRPEVQVRFDPAIAAKRILVKLWNPYETDSIYVGSVDAYGFDGPRCFPSMAFR